MQVIFTNDNDIIGRLIRWFTKISWVKKGRVSHSAIRYGGDESEWMVESAEHGVCPNWWNYFSTRRKIYAKYEVLGIDEVILEKIVDTELNKVMHDGYDFGNLFGFAIIIFWYKLTGKRLDNNKFSWRGHFACTDLLCKIFIEVKKQTGIDYFGNLDPKNTFPEQAFENCESKPELFRLVTEK